MISEDSSRDFDQSAKKVAQEFKTYIKTNNADYSNKLKTFLNEGFHNYYEEMTKRLNDEYLAQESKQNNIQQAIDNTTKDIEDLHLKTKQRHLQKRNIMSKIVEYRRKAAAFRAIFINKQENKNFKKIIEKADYFRRVYLKRKAIKLIKSISLFQKNKEYDEKLKSRTDAHLNKYQESMKKQEYELLFLIEQAEEKLKHENRKKIQAKLALDQMVLRGVSALNMQAISLSQNSLNCVYRTDYVKELDRNYKTMLFKNTQENITSNLKSQTMKNFK